MPMDRLSLQLELSSDPSRLKTLPRRLAARTPCFMKKPSGERCRRTVWQSTSPGTNPRDSTPACIAALPTRFISFFSKFEVFLSNLNHPNTRILDFAEQGIFEY